MKPTFQTKLWSADGIHSGNGFAACLASILEFPLWMIPPFEDMFGRHGEWIGRCEEWLNVICHRDFEQFSNITTAPDDFYIGNGPSPRGVQHSCVYHKGSLVHDPHPLGGGLVEWQWGWRLDQLGAIH